MKQSPKRQAVVVGLFITVAIAIFAAGILTIGDLRDTFTHTITVSAVFDNVGGLKKGDNVWFSGVKVGTVKKLAFHGESQVQVELNVDLDAAPFLHDDALAKIGSDGLIGNRIVVLYGGTPEAGTLEDGDVLGIGKSVSTDEVMAMLQENNTNIKVITGKLARGEGTLGKLLQDDALYTQVTDTVASLNSTSESAKTLTVSLSAFAAKLNQPGHLPNDLVTDDTTYAELTGAVGKFKTAGASAAELMDGLAEGAADPNSTIGVALHDKAAGTDAKVALANLSQSSALLAEDLAALQHNFLLRGYFRRKAKAEAKAAESDAGAAD